MKSSNFLVRYSYHEHAETQCSSSHRWLNMSCDPVFTTDSLKRSIDADIRGINDLNSWDDINEAPRYELMEVVVVENMQRPTWTSIPRGLVKLVWSNLIFVFLFRLFGCLACVLLKKTRVETFSVNLAWIKKFRGGHFPTYSVLTLDITRI